MSTRSALIKLHSSEIPKPVSDLHRLRNMTDSDIEEGIRKDKDAAPVLVNWPKNAKVTCKKQDRS